LSETTKKEETTVENVKSLQTDLDINLGTVAKAVEKEKPAVEESAQKSTTEVLSLENLEAKAQKEFQDKKLESVSTQKKAKETEKKDAKKEAKSSKKVQKIDLKALQKKLAEKVAKGKAKLAQKKKAAVKTSTKDKKKIALTSQALSEQKLNAKVTDSKADADE